jgi:acyl carrier protein
MLCRAEDSCLRIPLLLVQLRLARLCHRAGTCAPLARETKDVRMRDTDAWTEIVRDIVATTLRIPEPELPDNVSQDSCERWTSLRHMTLLMTLEDHFDMTFTMEEMTSMTSLPSILTTINQRAVVKKG